MEKMRQLARAKAIQKGGDMRAKAMAMAAQRKEEFLGARVPRELRDKVVQRAEQLGIPVSLFIRNMLEELFKDMPACVDKQHIQVEPARPSALAKRFAQVLGWEDMRLHRSVACSGCGHALTPGMSVTLGLGMKGGEHVVLCQHCKSLV